MGIPIPKPASLAPDGGLSPSRAQVAYEQIRRRIVSGELTADRPLSETTLAEQLQVSRTPVREAIRRLETEGLLEQRAKQGTFIRTPDRREMHELFELRIHLEPAAAARAARRRRARLIRRLEAVLAEMAEATRLLEAAATPEEQLALWHRHKATDRAFHQAILREAGNRRVCKVVDDAGVLILALKYPNDLPATRLGHNSLLCAQTYQEHADVLDAIHRGDPRGAFVAMRRHLVHGRSKALDYFDWLARQ